LKARGNRTRRLVSATACAAILSVPMAALDPAAAFVAGTTLFAQSFHDNAVDPAYPVSLPGLPPGLPGSNFACLSAAGNPGPRLHSCTSDLDPEGAGALRLTDRANFRQGGVFAATSVPTSRGLDVTFNTYQYGGSGADGIAFVLAAVDPADPLSPPTMGYAGGALGYSADLFNNIPGLTHAYLGIGFDTYGNFSTVDYQGTGCANPPFIFPGPKPGQVVVRGPGNEVVGYCGLAGTATNASSPSLYLRRGFTRADSRVPVEVLVNPTASSFTSPSKIPVQAHSYAVAFTTLDGKPHTLSGSLPTVPAGLYPANWLNPDGTPRQLAFGWTSSTGSATDFHEIDQVNVTSFTPVPVLRVVTQTSYNGKSPQPGDPVTYTVSPSVAPGVEETLPVTVTETTPQGVVPLGAFGPGWVCRPPAGRQITCTNRATPFRAGTSLPPLTVVAIVNSTGVTPSLIQKGSVVTASSVDANPGLAWSTTPGPLPPSPSGITLTPDAGPVGGGTRVGISGAHVTEATAVLIGTTAEHQAGTPVTLLPCPSGPAPGCFAVDPDGTLTIQSMPPRTGPTTVKVAVVSLGVSGSAPYVYANRPGAPAPPTVTAGTDGVVVSWKPPADNGGSPITGYIVTPFLNGVAQPGRSFDASTTTRTITGLTPGSRYTFTVAAQNAAGIGPASPQSSPVVALGAPSGVQQGGGPVNGGQQGGGSVNGGQQGGGLPGLKEEECECEDVKQKTADVDHAKTRTHKHRTWDRRHHRKHHGKDHGRLVTVQTLHTLEGVSGDDQHGWHHRNHNSWSSHHPGHHPAYHKVHEAHKIHKRPRSYVHHYYHPKHRALVAVTG
jgi:large repetitive protein